MSLQPATYVIRIELLNDEEEVVGTVDLTGANGPGPGHLVAGGICNYGPATAEEIARFLDVLAADLRGARPGRLDG